MASLYSVIIADDHVSFRQVLKNTLEEIEGLHIIGEASDGFELLGLLRTLIPDVIMQIEFQV